MRYSFQYNFKLIMMPLKDGWKDANNYLIVNNPDLKEYILCAKN